MEEQKRNPAQGLSESEQVQVRRQKLADLQAAGNDPFTLTKFPQDAYSADLKEEYKDLPNETDSGKQVALAGRMMSKRVMGKASFAHLRDDKGDIQLYVRRSGCRIPNPPFPNNPVRRAARCQWWNCPRL